MKSGSAPFAPYHAHLPALSFRHVAGARDFLTNGAPVNGRASSSRGKTFAVPGATAATIFMLGLLHARRLYEDKKVEEARKKGLEIEFSPDFKASFMRLAPLRCISRIWGFVSSLEIPMRLRPYIYKGWARAFHTNLEECALPLEAYTSLQDFFAHGLKAGSRHIDSDPFSLVSPVDGTVMRVGILEGSGAMIEQVKGFSYSAVSLLGEKSCLPMIIEEDMIPRELEKEKNAAHSLERSWWRIFLASPKVKNCPACPKEWLFYCVLHLQPGDYHRVHSPVDWQVFLRRHFAGHLFPTNERATHTIRNLYVENERVVLEGQWKGGFIALAAVGATIVGSIKLQIEPELQTNVAGGRFLHCDPPHELVYEPRGIGIALKKGDEVAVFNMGSTVVLIFQASLSEAMSEEHETSNFKLCVKNGDRIRMGEPIGRWRA